MDKNNVAIETLELNGNFRTTPSKESLQELADSIRSQGILQPLVVRVHPTKAGILQIIAGQRRYLAAKLADQKHVPVSIKQISDEQIPEIQIVENLQRADVHPMQEAIAFKALQNSNKKRGLAEISLLVGKNGVYVANRIKLNDLIPEYQKLFAEDEITMHLALKICKLTADNQSKLYKSVKARVHEYDLKRFIGDLNDAPFNLEDPTLNPKRGACTTCPLNSNNNIFLFPDAVDKGKCMDCSCYELKSKVGVKKTIDAAISDPTMILITEDNTADSEKLRKAGTKVLRATGEYGNGEMLVTEIPEPYEEDRDDYDTEAEYKEELKRANDLYKIELDKFNKKVEKGEIQKAVVVDGRNAGKIRYVKANKKTTASAGNKAIKSGTATSVDVKAVIEGIQERKKRAEELDFEKVTTRLIQEISDNDKSLRELRKLSTDEWGIFLLHLLDGLCDSDIEKSLKIKLTDDFTKDAKLMAGLDPTKVGLLIRNHMNDAFTSSRYELSKDSHQAFGIRAIARSIGVKVDAIQKESDDIAAAREERVKERIAKLKPSKPAAKKKAKKK